MIIGIFAPQGKMGQALISVLEEQHINYCVFDKNNMEEFLKKSDVIIDFSLPDGTQFLINQAFHYKIFKPLVIGTTGLQKITFDHFQQYVQYAPLFYAANFSLGTFVQKKLAVYAAKLLHDYDIEIFEAHHNKKKDAPSGTAKMLGTAIAESHNQTLETIMVDHIQHSGKERQKGSIGFSASRGGGITGEHTVYFFGEHEQLHITHKGYSKKLYAQGAIKAAFFIQQQKIKKIYAIDDMLA